MAYAVKLYSGCESLAMVLPVLFVPQFLMIHFFTRSIMTRRRENNSSREALWTEPTRKTFRAREEHLRN